MKDLNYDKILKEKGSFRKAAESLNITKTKFTRLWKKELGLCQRTTSCRNIPLPGKVTCQDCLKRVIKQQSTSVTKKIYMKEYKKQNKDRIKSNAKKNYYKNHEQKREYANKYYRDNYKVKGAEKRARYRALKSQAMPSWVNKKDLSIIYSACPENHHVDHIIPLKHPSVCGLHVPWNLQILPSHVNESKANNFDGTYDNDSWMNDYSHQYRMRLRTLTEDALNGCNFNIKARDLILNLEKLSSEHVNFIKKYEWLGTIGRGVEYCFTARHDKKLAAVVLLGIPNQYVKDFTKDEQCLIQRGAAASWAPKNTNSRLLMYACRYLNKYEGKNIFYGYADYDAKEAGVIYKSCNFKYLGDKFGAKTKYILPDGSEKSGQYFNSTYFYKKIAKNIGIDWQSSWQKPSKYKDLNKIPADKLKLIKNSIRKFKQTCSKIKIPAKGKYILNLT